MINPRSRCRDIALQLLYMEDQNSWKGTLNHQRFVTNRMIDPNYRKPILEMVQGVQEDRERIDAMINEIASNWRTDRMPAIDRNILRLGAYELIISAKAPMKVVITEAIELAKRYGSAQSSRFINAVLSKMHDRHRQDKDKARADSDAAVEMTEMPASGVEKAVEETSASISPSTPAPGDEATP